MKETNLFRKKNKKKGSGKYNLGDLKFYTDIEYMPVSWSFVLLFESSLSNV